MAFQTSAGSSISISAALPATPNAAGYNALTLTKIGEVSNLGEFGREYELVTFTPIAERTVQKRKGSINEGSISLEMALDSGDAGQTLLRAGAASDANYSFQITTQNGAKFFFQAQVMSFKISVGEANQITTATAMLEITTQIIGDSVGDTI